MSDEEFAKAFKVAEDAVFANTGQHLSDVEVVILRGAWQGQTYEKIAETCGYSRNYFGKDVGTNLWKLLSEALGEKVSKTNFRQALLRRVGKEQTLDELSTSVLSASAVELESPEGSVALDSPFYVERSHIESDCYKAIEQSGALIRIKAPGKMGKTSLLDRIVAHAEKQGYRTVRLNLGDADETLFDNLDKFLRWFSANVTLQLKLPDQLDNYWNEAVIGSKVSCKTYFQMHLLQQINSPLALALEEVDRVFPYFKLAEEFFSMLRSWHEEANNRDIWKQLRLVVVHSTEVYIPLKIHQSPFNVGLPVKLTEFTPEQVEDLARRHGLNWEVQLGVQGFAPLMAMVGGHPYLVRLALYELARQGVALEKLLQDATTDAGIYKDHLRRLLRTLREHSELAAAFRQIMTTTEAVQIDTMQAYRLESLGLIERCGDHVRPRCKLYRQYFRERLGDED